MMPIIEFQRRALTGRVMREREFDMAFARKVREIVARYQIKFDPETIIADDALADAVFQGGVDLLAEVGLYHKDTQRVIELSKEEILEIAREAWARPREETLGKGKDAVTIRYRTADDPRPPVTFFGIASIPSPEELYVPYIQSFAQEELAQGLVAAGLISAGGVENRIGTPGEMVVCLAETRYKQEVARRVGKPDMFLGATSAESPAVLMALCFPGGVERHNNMLNVSLHPELKVDWGRLLMALFVEERGMVPFMVALAVMGALCRGAEDSAVTQVASLLALVGYAHGTLSTTTTSSQDRGHSDRAAMWAFSAAARASERHIGLGIGSAAQSIAGAGTEMALYEKAAQALSRVASGTAWYWGSGCRRGRGLNATAGLEGRMVAETAVAVAGMSRDWANEVLKKIVALYEDRFDSAPEGKTFPELYDIKTVQPTAEYLGVYQRAKEQLARLGVPYRN